ncbi:hypothetical protein MBSD_n0473 [Mizugakiibacter sediminis]|uniref:Membrane protein n=1 Tax=Mizugakiibacter sediminis TaxID=1475481 RepID=A0A0K8QK45_9GAMM|nr:hypothetical protein [Mizugakiibacter sediminis]GAP65184.1 hypothetical protein MBSD_n0473 [Mizugakiibacter sediminis]
MRFLAVLLLAPWLAILGGLYWAFPRRLPRTFARRAFDLAALLIAAAATLSLADAGYSADHGDAGAIWKQVIAALAAYGAFAGVLLAALLLRARLFRARAVPAQGR